MSCELVSTKEVAKYLDIQEKQGYLLDTGQFTGWLSAGQKKSESN